MRSFRAHAGGRDGANPMRSVRRKGLRLRFSGISWPIRAHAREKDGTNLGESSGRRHGERLLQKTHVRRTLRFTRRKGRERGKVGNVWKSCLNLSWLPIGIVKSSLQSSPPLNAADTGSMSNSLPRSKIPLMNGIRSTYTFTPSPLSLSKRFRASESPLSTKYPYDGMISSSSKSLTYEGFISGFRYSPTKCL